MKSNKELLEKITTLKNDLSERFVNCFLDNGLREAITEEKTLTDSDYQMISESIINEYKKYNNKNNKILNSSIQSAFLLVNKISIAFDLDIDFSLILESVKLRNNKIKIKKIKEKLWTNN